MTTKKPKAPKLPPILTGVPPAQAGYRKPAKSPQKGKIKRRD